LAILADVGYKFDGFTAQDSTPTAATEGDDKVLGTNVADTLNGLGGNDFISGVAGNDSLIGGAGNDTLKGGGGQDTFFFGAANGQDQINDFVVADDKIQIAAGLGFSNGSDVLVPRSGTFFNGKITGGGLFSDITLSAGNKIRVFHDQLLTAANFIII